MHREMPPLLFPDNIVDRNCECNRDIKIIIVNPSFIQNDFDLEVVIKVFAATGDLGQLKPTGDNNVYNYFDGKFLVHTKGFKEYMQDRNILSM
jgi:hypothetical protein